MGPRHPDFAVVGRGLMGTACARHLAEAGHSVVLIGPDEPADRRRHAGPFGSFHDAGRITRRIAHDPDWVLLSGRSIDRYADLEARSGVLFYTPCGAVMAGPTEGQGSEFTQAFQLACGHIPHEEVRGASLSKRFPMFRFAPGTQAAFDPAGGTINPRLMRQAEEHLACDAGAMVEREAVVSRDGTTLTLANGAAIPAGHIVVATGAYAGPAPLTPDRPDLKVFQRTVVYAEVSGQDARTLTGIPSLIFVPEGQTNDLYLLPPLRYPDGKLYLKIGGEADSPRATTSQDLTLWFQSDGSAEAGLVLLRHLTRLMPDLAIRATQQAPARSASPPPDIPTSNA